MISTTVGQVKDRVVTSREVLMHYFLDKALYGKTEELKKAQPPALESKAFSQQLTNHLLERVVYLESQNFPVAKVSGSETEAAVKKALSRLQSHPEWRRLEPSGSEVRDAVEQMIQAKKFIQFKAESSTVPVTDTEAEQYYEENKLRFGSLPFENFRENIKAYLTRTQSDQRLKEWFEVLQSKYKVRNFLSEI